jgi:hypothetical protein
MTLLTVYRASEALGGLYRNEHLTAREAYGIMKLRAALREDAAFFIQRRNELLRRHGEPDEENPGRYTFPDVERMKAFEAAIRELADTETNIKYDPVTLRGEIEGVTPETLEALEGFVGVT